MPRTITIDPITRLEGHGKISIFLDDDGAVREGDGRDALAAELKKRDEEIASLKDVMQRRQADFENFKKRNLKQQEEQSEKGEEHELQHEAEDRHAGGARIELRRVLGARADVDVHHHRGQHADRGGDNVVAEGDFR